MALALCMIGMVMPASEQDVRSPSSQLDAFMPRYQFHEFHKIDVAAPPAQVYRAIQEVTAGEIPMFQTLTWIRRFGRTTPTSIVNAPASAPILEVATTTSIMYLARDEPEEVVIGTTVVSPTGTREGVPVDPAAFKAFTAPGFALAAMNFRVAAAGRGSVVTTETRVFATSLSARRRFAMYWRVIYPGSALIRRSWLHAVRRRAERY